MRTLSVFFVFILISCAAYASDMALYLGHPNPDWYPEDVMQADGDTIMRDLGHHFSTIKGFDDSQAAQLQAWVEANMSDAEMDILWMNGCMPSVLYPNPNVQQDGSLAEQWLDGGNMIINVADWFGYCTYETGARGSDNGGTGAESILDLSGIIISSDNTAITITAAGKKYLPSLGAETMTDRPVPRAAVVAPWEIAEVFGESSNGSNLDPLVIYNTETDAYMAFMNQANSGHSVDRAQMTIEFVNNWVAQVLGIPGSTAVEPGSKLTSTWGALKN